MKQKFIYSEQYHDYLRLLGEAGGALSYQNPMGMRLIGTKQNINMNPLKSIFFNWGQTSSIYQRVN